MSGLFFFWMTISGLSGGDVGRGFYSILVNLNPIMIQIIFKYDKIIVLLLLRAEQQRLQGASCLSLLPVFALS